ncbi:MAG: flagellar protein export ATPase FliI [Marinagarivorans sp.]|nr:flagellar protein export ATPase FliI [Marinagarivorans sp.]
MTEAVDTPSVSNPSQRPKPRSATEWLKGKRQYQSLNQPPLANGRLTRMVGLTLEAVGLNVPVGTYCEIIREKANPIEAEVVGFSGSTTYLMPIRAAEGLKPGLRVKPVLSDANIPIGMQMLGRVINGLGQPLDGKGPLQGDEMLDLSPKPINPMQRDPVKTPLDVGIRAINALLTVGEGQRLGLFAGSGVGKSVLLGMMTRFTEAEIVVVGLIGERGREVKEFIEHILGEEGLKRAVVVAAPADEAPLMRLRASYLSTRIAEYYRDKGKKVLLLMDSLTRFAQAQREISLAIGEPPATKGYPPSVFARLPELVERAGNGAKGQGSVTAFYTVLTEGDDLQDPIADSARAILDGHIVLSRQLAEEGIYPAINIEASISRVMPNIVSPEQLKNMQNFKQLLAAYRQNKDLISVGAYVAGADATIDKAIERHPYLMQFIGQSLGSKSSLLESTAHLKTILISPAQVKNQK